MSQMKQTSDVSIYIHKLLTDQLKQPYKEAKEESKHQRKDTRDGKNGGEE